MRSKLNKFEHVRGNRAGTVPEQEGSRPGGTAVW